MPVKKFCLGGTLSWQTFVLADCNREVNADVKIVKSTLCHDQTPAIGMRVQNGVLENESISSSCQA